MTPPRLQLTLVDAGMAGMMQSTQAGFEDVPLPLKRLTQGFRQALSCKSAINSNNAMKQRDSIDKAETSYESFQGELDLTVHRR